MAVARDTRLIVGHSVLKERSWEGMQTFVEALPPAEQYCSDELALYQDLWWPPGSIHIVSEGKRDTHTIESINANLRTYLGRLKRKSRCFSRCIKALRRAVRLFVWHYNRRQRLLLSRPHMRGALALVF
jgi:IS1 family transposase